MEAQLKRAGPPGPRVIGIDEIAIRKGHTLSDRGERSPAWATGLVWREPNACTLLLA
jgi:hypothetical protein